MLIKKNNIITKEKGDQLRVIEEKYYLQSLGWHLLQWG